MPLQTLPPSRANFSRQFPGILPDLAWWAFCVWTAIGFVVMPLNLGRSAVDRSLSPGFAKDTLDTLLHVADAVWIYLAAIVVYLQTAASEGLTTARRWAVILLIGSGVFEWIGAQTGFPFGPYRYTDNFGWRISGVLPVAIPLAWMIVVLCGRALILRFRPTSTRFELALGTAAMATLTDANLEAVAWKIRGYWLWYPDEHGPVPAWPPVQNYVAWFALSFALCAVLPPNYSLRSRQVASRRLILVLVLMNALFVVVYATRWLRLKT